MSRHSIAFALLLALAASGCANTYKGPGVADLPRSQISILQNNGDLGLNGLNILEVDGRHRGAGFIRTYELAPGKHRIKFEWLGYGWRLQKGSNMVELDFTAAPARTYEIKFGLTRTEFDKGVFRSWIEDVATRQSVSSIVEQATPPPK